MLLTWKTPPNRAEACKKKETKSQKHFNNYILPMRLKKNARKLSGNREKCLKQKGIGVICGNKHRVGIKLFSNNSVYIELLSNCTSRYNNITGIKHSH